MAGSQEKSKGGLMSLIIPIVAVTLIGGGGGAFLGFSVFAPSEPEKGKAAGQGAQNAPEKETAEAPAKAPAKSDAHGKEAHGKDAHGKDAHGAEGHGKDAEDAAKEPPLLQVKELPPVVTNLGGEKKGWVRLQSAIVYDAHENPHVESLIPSLMSDITAFLNTLDMSAIEGPDGLRRLQEELSERAATRSERNVKEFIIESLVVQ